MPKKIVDQLGKGPYKSRQGSFRTSSLFKEKINPVSAESFVPLFTLDEQDHDGYISLHRLYVEYSDPAEHSFAKAVFNSWEQWKRILACDWFEPFILRWREEVRAKIVAEGLTSIRLLAQNRDTPATALQASKYLVQGNFDISPEALERVMPKRGRPKKAKPVEDPGHDKSVDSDFKRLGLH